ncbi:hypothetical protein NicSoilB8_45930 (plasmid) [Arthrobacter sp. NicSoilB8]|nr:hypothetical protein NicSoilB8_45930 [Arthrobacter sp. NicSoilB8]
MSHNRGEATNANPASRYRTSHVKTHSLSSRELDVVDCACLGFKGAIDFACDGPLEASFDLAWCLSLPFPFG